MLIELPGPASVRSSGVYLASTDDPSPMSRKTNGHDREPGRAPLGGDPDLTPIARDSDSGGDAAKGREELGLAGALAWKLREEAELPAAVR
jgi:hypothetical protein